MHTGVRLTATPSANFNAAKKGGIRKMVIATLELVDIGGEKYLAGEANDSINGMEKMILVLRKKTPTTFVVHAIPVDPADQSLRALLSGSQSLECELVVAIRETIKPTPKHRTVRRRKVKK